MRIFTVAGNLMPPKRSAPKSRNIKITEEAYAAARIAAGFCAESIVEFVSRIVKERSEEIIDEQYKLRRGVGGAAVPKKKSGSAG